MPNAFQLAGQKKPVDRTKHVWERKGPGRFKCALRGHQ